MFSRIIPSLAILGLVGAAAAQNGGISGRVTSTADGSPVSNAAVTYRRLVAYLPNPGTSAVNPQLAPGEVYFSGSVSTDVNGNYSANALPPGSYQVCVDATSGPPLNPCLWGSAPLAVVAAANVAPLDVAVVPGVFLEVTINDPQGLLPASEISPLDFPHLIVGVYFGSGAFLAAQRTSAGTGTQTYSMPVPAGVPLNLWLQSRWVTLTDSSGNALSSSGARLPFVAAAGTPALFTVNVTGPLAQTSQERVP